MKQHGKHRRWLVRWGKRCSPLRQACNAWWCWSAFTGLVPAALACSLDLPSPSPLLSRSQPGRPVLLAPGVIAGALLAGIATVGATVGTARRSARPGASAAGTFEQSVLEQAEAAILSLTPDGTIRSYNRAAERLLGFRAEEVVGESALTDLLDRREVGLRARELGRELGRTIAPGFEVVSTRVHAGGQDDREWTCARNDGSRFPARVSVGALRDISGALEGFVAVVRDLTEQKRAELEWHQFKQEIEHRMAELSQQKAALDQHSIVAVTDTAGRILYANDKFCEISRYSREELLGQDHRIVKSSHHPPEFWREMYRAIGRGEVWRGEIKNRAKDGSFYWVYSVIVPLTDAAGKPHRYVAIRTDITARKRAEEEICAMHGTLREAHREVLRKNEEIQDFYHTLSHELKTPLTSAREFVSIVRDGLAGPVNDAQREYLAIAQDSCNQLRACIDDLLDATRLETGKLSIDLKAGSLGALARRLVAAFAPRAGTKRIRLRCEEQPSLPDVPFDQHRITQVINNLVANALKFTPEGGAITVSVSEAGRHRDFLQVSVSDTGPGIEADKLGRVFDRHYQIQRGDAAHGQGLGLGLYICRELVQIHGGKTWVESRPGAGSTFSFVLPKHPAARRWSLLVVDDDPQMRQVLCDILEQAEFNVILAASGSEALRLITRQAPDLVLLDVVMPDLDGAATLREIRKTWAGMPVILHTGFPNSELVARAREWSPLTVLAKPWLPRQLVETIRNVRVRRETEFWTRRGTAGAERELSSESGKCPSAGFPLPDSNV
jgi:PAS domain S-box-containing protein